VRAAGAWNTKAALTNTMTRLGFDDGYPYLYSISRHFQALSLNQEANTWKKKTAKNVNVAK
jgi:hypothetical protein